LFLLYLITPAKTREPEVEYSRPAILATRQPPELEGFANLPNAQTRKPKRQPKRQR